MKTANFEKVEQLPSLETAVKVAQSVSQQQVGPTGMVCGKVRAEVIPAQ